MKAHSGSRIRRLYGEPSDLVDMVIIDIPEGLPVPSIHADSSIPFWNEHPTQLNDKGRKESIFIHSCFEMAKMLLKDERIDPKQLTNDVMSHYPQYEVRGRELMKRSTRKKRGEQ